jgi:hypothetical protein
MATKTENTEKRSALVGGFVTPAVKDIISQKAETEDRSVSAILSRLLESHPEIKRAMRERRATVAQP